jgi:HEAT repeat protein
MPVSPARIPALVLAAAVVAFAPLPSSRAQAAPSDDALARAVDADDLAAIKSAGPAVMSSLARLYTQADGDRRVRLATVFYRLGWKSEEAKAAMMPDAHTPNQALRINVQYALGRVSDDVAVVDVLLENMQHDASLVFRDKAACALAYDQVHLGPAQKVRLFEGLIRALSDPKPDVRRIAALVLQIQTGQDKGFHADDPPELRGPAIGAWRKWLAEYRSQL